MSRAVLSLGSNLGDRLSYLRLATDGLGDAVRAASPVYETAPWGVVNQPDFLNAVVLVEADGVDEWGWLDRAQELERAAERVREQHWGPRTLDVDVVHVPGVRSDDPRLRLPHPGTPSRATVLIPWLAVEPNGELPGYGPLRTLLDQLSDEERAGVQRRDDLTLR